MNLARAFVERKRLTNYVNELADEFASASLSEETTVEKVSNKKPKSNINVDEVYGKLKKATVFLSKFNAIIDEANAKSDARLFLSSLVGLKRVANLLEVKVRDAESFEESVDMYDNYAYCEATKSRGDYVTHTYKLISNIDWAEELKKTKKKIVEIEDSLSDVNSTIKVEIPADLQEFLDNM